MNYSDYYLTESNHIKFPFAHLETFVRLQSIYITAAEARAIDNTHQFIRSLAILVGRIKSYLALYKPDSWVNVPFNKLFLDTQSYFLFVQQYLEDLSMIIRFSFKNSEREQLTPKFKQLNKKLISILPETSEFRKYIELELDNLLEIKDIRDDICHRTSFGHNRRATFPRKIDVFSSGGGKGDFVADADLKRYIGTVTQRVLAYACNAENFVNENLKEQHEGTWLLDPPASIVKSGEIDLTKTSKEPLYEPGTAIIELSKESYDSIMYFIQE